MIYITLQIDTLNTLGTDIYKILHIYDPKSNGRMLMMDTWKGGRSFEVIINLASGYNYNF